MSDTGSSDGRHHSRAHSDPASWQQNQPSENQNFQQLFNPVHHMGTLPNTPQTYSPSSPANTAYPGDLGYTGYHGYSDYHGYHGPPFTGYYHTMPFYPTQGYPTSPHVPPVGRQNQSYQRQGGGGGGRNYHRQENQRGRDYRPDAKFSGYSNKRNGYERQGARPKQYSAKKESRQNNSDGSTGPLEQRHGNKSEKSGGASNDDQRNSEKTNGPDANVTQESGSSSKDRNDKSGKTLSENTEEINPVSDTGSKRMSGQPSGRYRSNKVKYPTWHSRDNKGKNDRDHRKDSSQSGYNKNREKQVRNGGRQGAKPRRRSLSLERSGKHRSRSRSGGRPATSLEITASEQSQSSDQVKIEQSNDSNEANSSTQRNKAGLQERDSPAQGKVKEKPWKKNKDKENTRLPDGDKYGKKEGGRGKSLKCWSTSQSSRSSSYENLSSGRRKNTVNMKETSNESQTGSMIEALTNASYECMVCCEVIKCESAVWNCHGCYTVFHLHCIRKWARSPVATLTVESSNGWRCPACQNVCTKAPNAYRCFCGKVREPAWQRTETPHSCGEVCRKRRANSSCPHPCNILCHPGPCPTCPVTVTKMCACGKTKKSIRCGTAMEVHCDSICAKKLNCGIHSCKRICHKDKCDDCTVMIEEDCYCGKSSQEVPCGSEVSKANDGPGCYACEEKCGRQLSCGNHTCEDQCHSGPCQPCQLTPSLVTHCHCGQTPLSSLLSSNKSRTSCLDPIPTCDQICNKKLKCCSEDEEHLCKYTCHEGDCGPCTGLSTVKCQCGYMDKEVPCAELAIKSGPPSCDKRCNKKRKCGRHRCNQRCCVDQEHICPLVCGRKLSCGLHKCDEPCHSGNCERCWQTGFDELTCHCGAAVLFPPIKCGTQAPECGRLCTRQHECDHPVQHACHSEEKCPPCTFLVQRQCMGNHETRNSIPCHIKDISCGRACGKELFCKQHKCLKICHKNDCDEECSQPCTEIRSECGHPCAAPCHPGKPCPKIACKSLINITCKCGNRKEQVPCLQGGDELQMVHSFQRMATSQLASRMRDIQSGQSVDISGLMEFNEGHKQRQLECTEECAVIERNRRFADALHIESPDLSSKINQTTYCQFLKDQARQNSAFVASVEKDLSNLIKSLQQSKLTKKSHSFSPMNRDNRRVVHELAEIYGCETQSYDQEPKRNTVATAVKNKSQIPTVTLTSYVQQQLHPKAPPPIPHVAKADAVRSTVQAAKQSTDLLGSKTETTIDYFDMVQ